MINWENSVFCDGGVSARKEAAEQAPVLPTPPPILIAYMEVFIGKFILAADKALSGGNA